MASRDPVVIVWPAVAADDESLEEHLARPQPWEAIVRLFLAVGDELVSAREARPDVGLDDVRISKEGQIRLRQLVREQEEARGAPVEADAFSFSLALYEALYGEPPFEADSPEAFAAAVAKGPRERPADTLVPARIHAVVARGLRGESAKDRYVDLGDMLDDLGAALDLADKPEKRRPPPFALPIVLAASATVLFLAGVFYTHKREERERGRLPLVLEAQEAGATCMSRTAAWDAVWSPEKKKELSRAFEEDRLAPHYAKDAFRRLDEATVAYVADAKVAEDAACAPKKGGARECLDLLRSDLAALLATLSAEPWGSHVHRAATAVLALDPPVSCAEAAPDELPPAVIVAAWQLYTTTNQRAHVSALLGDPARGPRAFDAQKPGSDRRTAAAFAVARAVMADAEDGRLDAAAWEPRYDALIDAGLGDLSAFVRQARGGARADAAAATPEEALAQRFAVAIAEAEALGLHGLAARAGMARAVARPGPADGSVIAALRASAAKDASPETTSHLDATLIDLEARAGKAPVVHVECMQSSAPRDAGVAPADAGSRAAIAGCLRILAAAGEVSWAGRHADVEVEGAKRAFGEWHVAHARALVRQAEAAVSRGENGDLPARAAIAILERTILEGPGLPAGAPRADGGIRETMLGPLPDGGRLDLPRGRADLHAYLARARAAAAITVRDLDPALALAGRGPDEVILTTPLVTRAELARKAREDATRFVGALRALLPRIWRGALRARALAEIGHAFLAKGDTARAAAALGEARTLAGLLGRRHRSDLHFGLARALAPTDRPAAIAIAKEAAEEALEGPDRQAITTWLGDPR